MNLDLVNELFIQKIGVRAEAEPLKKSFDFFQCTTILAPYL